MPELPDIAAYISALEPRIVGQPLERVRLASVFLLRTADPPLATPRAASVRELRRIGKRIAIGLDGDLWLVLHLMIAGRLHWRPPRAQTRPAATTSRPSTSPTARWCSPRPARKRRASLHVVRGEEALRAIDPGGIDVFAADLDAFRAALTVENRTLKRALTDPRILSGIGNAYSDEILHAAQLSPDRAHAQAQRRRMAAAVRRHARDAAALDRPAARRSAARIPRKGHRLSQRHGRARPLRPAVPALRRDVQRIRYADNETNYCARCQTGGTLLADRSLSRLLKADWPRTLEELETMKRK